MNHLQFKKLIKDIPSIEVSLNWNNTEGQGDFEKELELNSFILSTNFSCLESGIFDAGDNITAPSFSSDGLDIFDIEFNVYNEEGEEMKLSDKQEQELSNQIKSSIISN